MSTEKRIERIVRAAEEWVAPPDVTVAVTFNEHGGTANAAVQLEGLHRVINVGFTVDDSRPVIQRHLKMAVERLRQRKANLVEAKGA